MKKLKIINYLPLLLLLLLLFTNPLWAEGKLKSNQRVKDDLGELVLTIKNIKKIQGQLRIVVMSDKKTFEATTDATPSGTDLAIILKVTDKKTIITYDGLVEGEYAIKVFHDVNSNGKLDTSVVGVPKEPYGFSNNVRATFGPPKYEDCLFKIVAGKKNKMVIKL